MNLQIDAKPGKIPQYPQVNSPLHSRELYLHVYGHESFALLKVFYHLQL